MRLFVGEKGGELLMRYTWVVVGRYGDVQSGTVDTFQEAIRALQDWQGMPDDPPHRSYQILPQIISSE